MKKRLPWVIGCFISLSGLAQPNIVTVDSSAQHLVSALLGNGTTVSNAVLDCGLNASGVFSQTTANIGIASGILLSNGTVNQGIFNYNHFNSSSNYHDVNDSNLLSLDTAALYDVCMLEFDFVPRCDSLKITYVFASEEYPSYVNKVNDVFGMFLTGPKPGGGTYDADNIARLPNGDPVSINTINSHSDSTYFVPNWPTCHCTHHALGFYGFTVPITSKAGLIPCNQYHLKIAVADVLDHIYDSVVFLGGGSFGCASGPAVSAAATPATCTHSGSAAVHVTNLTGTTTYQWLPGNQTTDSISNLGPGTYTCLVSYNSICGPFTRTVTATVIQDLHSAHAFASNTNLCLNDTSHLRGPDSALSYHWIPATSLSSASIQSPIASPTVTTHYTVVSTYSNGCRDTGEIQINVHPIIANIGASQLIGYEPFSVVFYNNSQGATQSYWDFGNGNAISSMNDSLFQTYTAGNYTVELIATNSYCADTTSAYLHVETPIVLQVPNIFTPNADGINDEFSVKASGVREFGMQIFDRWGAQLFSSNSLSAAWNGLHDGKTVPAGTYYYTVKFTDIKGKEHLQKGFLMLCR